MLNTITLQGRLTKDPELRTTQSGVSVTSFTLAVERDYTQGTAKETDFVDCVAWRQTGEFVSKYFTRGQMALVTGRLQSRKWQDRDGNNRTNWEVNADHVYFGEAKKRESSAFEEMPAGTGKDNPFAGGYGQMTVDDGVLPF